MVARVLIIGDGSKKLQRLSLYLKKNFFAIHNARSFEQAVKIIRKQKIDVVLFSLFNFESENFFPLFRELCKIIPIIGIVESEQNIAKFDLDLILHIDYHYEIIRRKIEMFVSIRRLFEMDIADGIQFPTDERKKIAFLSFDNSNIINGLSLKNVDIIFGDCLSKQITDSDVFVINSEKTKSEKYCAELRLMNPRVPIVFVCQSDADNKYFNKLHSIGCTDVVAESVDKISFSCEINSLAKFKKRYDLYLKKLQEQLFCSLIDATTGVYNRSFLENHIRKYELSPNNIAVFMIDVDKFKSVNDRFGHAFADNALNNIAKIIKKNIRSSDIVARYGGDEFIIIMQNITKSVAADIATRIKSQIANFRLNDARFSVSVGVFCDNSCKSIKSAISSADELMYDVKQSGGNAVKICA